MNARARILTFFGLSGEAVDFDELYRQEVSRIYNYIRYRVGDRDLAEDLTAETFEKAWRSRQQYRHNLAGFSTWLYAIARRVLIDHARKLPTARKQQPVISLEAIADLPSDQITEDAVETRADFAHLTVLLSQLAERDRELVALRYGAGLTNRAIARLTGLSESNVGVLLHRAVQTLRQQWPDEPRDEKEKP